MKLRLMPPPAASSATAATRALEWLATAVLLQDETRRVVYANAAAENLFELSRRGFTGRTLREIVEPCAPLEAAIDKAISSNASYTEQEVVLTLPGRNRLHLAGTASPVDCDGPALLL